MTAGFPAAGSAAGAQPLGPVASRGAWLPVPGGCQGRGAPARVGNQGDAGAGTQRQIDGHGRGAPARARNHGRRRRDPGAHRPPWKGGAGAGEEPRDAGAHPGAKSRPVTFARGVPGVTRLGDRRWAGQPGRETSSIRSGIFLTT
jgi:hypothetical protein